MKERCLSVLLFLLLVSCATVLKGFSQSAEQHFYVVSFNAENFFDTIPSREYSESDFLPQGHHQWTRSRFYRKAEMIADVISDVGHLSWPQFVALQEVESDEALTALINARALRNASYRYVLSRYSDGRGVRVALLYLEGKFMVDRVEEWVVPDNVLRTRPLLCVVGRLLGGQSLAIVVVHLPSKRGGTSAKRLFREKSLSLLKQKCDSLSSAQPQLPVIVLGDFNTEARRSSRHTASDGILSLRDSVSPKGLYDVSGYRSKESFPGSYYFRRTWSQIDRMLVSGTLLIDSPDVGLRYVRESFTNVPLKGRMRVLQSGRRVPFRTYGGTVYLGGVSDHLPIRAEFVLKKMKEKSE